MPRSYAAFLRLWCHESASQATSLSPKKFAQQGRTILKSDAKVFGPQKKTRAANPLPEEKKRGSAVPRVVNAIEGGKV